MKGDFRAGFRRARERRRRRLTKHLMADGYLAGAPWRRVPSGLQAGARGSVGFHTGRYATGDGGAFCLFGVFTSFQRKQRARRGTGSFASRSRRGREAGGTFNETNPMKRVYLMGDLNFEGATCGRERGAGQGAATGRRGVRLGGRLWLADSANSTTRRDNRFNLDV